MYTSLMVTMTVTEARAALPDVVDRVLAGEEITLTRHGVAVAVVVRPDVLGVRRADVLIGLSLDVKNVIEQGRRTAMSSKPTLTVAQAESLVAEVKASRAQR